MEDFPVTRGSTTLKVELKAAEAWSELADGSRQYSWGGHGVSAAPLAISRQLKRSGAHVLVLTFPEPDLAPVAIGPANQQALWYFVIDVRSLPRSKWTHLQVKHLHRAGADKGRSTCGHKRNRVVSPWQRCGRCASGAPVKRQKLQLLRQNKSCHPHDKCIMSGDGARLDVSY